MTAIDAGAHELRVAGKRVGTTWVEREDLLIVGTLMLLAIAIRVPTLGSQSYWLDEAATLSLLHQSFGDMVGALPHSESAPPLYYVLAWVWARIWGFGEAEVRSLSLVCGVLTVPVAYRATAVFASRRAGLVAALLVAVNPFLVWYSQEARTYSLLILLAALSFLFFAQCQHEPTTRNLVLWSLASALALTSHYFAIFLIAIEAAVLLWLSPRRRQVIVACVPWAIVALSLLPLAVAQRSDSKTGWIGETGSLPSRLKETVKSLLVGINPPVTPWTALAAGLLTLAAIVMLIRWARPRERSGALLAGAVGVGALLLACMVDAAGYRYVIAKNVGWVLVPLLVPVAVGLAASRDGRSMTRAGTMTLVALCALSVGVVMNVYANPRYQREDWRAVGRALGAAPFDRAIATQAGADLRVARLYLPHTTTYSATGTRVREVIFVDAQPGGSGPVGMAGFRLRERHDTKGYRVYVFESPRPVVVPRATVLTHRIDLARSAWVGLQTPAGESGDAGP